MCNIITHFLQFEIKVPNKKIMSIMRGTFKPLLVCIIVKTWKLHFYVNNKQTYNTVIYKQSDTDSEQLLAKYLEMLVLNIHVQY